MELLLEEFFKKIWGFVNGINSFIVRLGVKLIFYILILVLIILGVYAFFGNRKLLAIILGLYILGEIAHFIRKSREKAVAGRVAEKKIKDKKARNERLRKKKKELLKKKKESGKRENKKVAEEKVVVDKDVLKNENSKNIGLLKSSKTKNKEGLLKKKN